MTNDPVVPGYEIRRYLGAGPSTAVWQALEESTALLVALKVPLPGGGSAEPSAQGSELAPLCRVQHPHLARVHGLVRTQTGAPVLVGEYIEGGTLPRLIQARDHLELGEVCELLTRLGLGLAHLHERGLAHGTLRPSNVMFNLDGDPVALDLGALALAAPSAAQVPLSPRSADWQADVVALAGVARSALGEAGLAQAPVRLRELLARCEAGQVPAVTDFLREIEPLAAPVPIRLAASLGLMNPSVAPLRTLAGRPAAASLRPLTPSGSTRESHPVRGWLPRSVPWSLMGAATALVLAGWFVSAGALEGSSPVPGPATPTLSQGTKQATASSTSSWKLRFQEVADRRAAALMSGDPSQLAQAEQAGSPAHQQDVALLARLQRSGARLEQLRYQVQSVAVVRATGSTARLSVSIQTQDYQRAWVPSAKTSAERVPQGQPQQVVVDLVREEQGWLLQQATASAAR